MSTIDLLKARFCFDSRRVEPGCVFVAIKGKNHDGHDFAQEALERGASFVVLERKLGLRNEIVVDNVIDFLIDLAGKKISPVKTVVGITGSSGKTFTKELLSHLIPGSFKTPGNMNTEIGLPISILNSYEGQEMAILEMGMNKPGDISKLCEIVKPDIGVVLNVGKQHIGVAGSEEDVFKGKMEMVDLSGRVVTTYDDDRVRNYVLESGKKFAFFGVNGGKVVLKDWRYENLRTEAIYMVNGEEVFLKLDGIWHRGHLLDLAASMCVLEELGLPFIPSRISSMEFPDGRFKLKILKGRFILDDTYNAGLKAFEVALETMERLNFGSKYAVVGPIKEQGEFSRETHRSLSRMLEVLDGVFVYSSDPESEYIRPRNEIHRSDDPKKLAEAVLKGTREGDVILFKASRSVELERVLREFEVISLD